MANITVLTKSSAAKLQAELDRLTSVERSAIAEKIQEARAQGDLSENAEYDSAKEEQGILEARISELEGILSHAKIIDDDEISTEVVGVGTTVKIKDMENSMEMDFTIVSFSEADIDAGKLADDSPVGIAILGKSIGEIAVAETPSGNRRFEILEIRKAED